MRNVLRVVAACALLAALVTLSVWRSTFPVESDVSIESDAPVATEDGIREGFMRKTEQAGAREAVTWFAEQVLTLPDLAYDCHGLAHEAGRVTATEIGPASAISLAPELCQGGYLHGVLQAAAGDSSTTARICTLIPSEYRSACAHGYGHLLAERYPTSIDAALMVCVSLYDENEPISAKDVSRCGGGAAMEYGSALSRDLGLVQDQHSSTMSPLEPFSVNLPDEQLHRPCKVLQDNANAGLEDAPLECVMHLALFWMPSPDVQFQGVIDRCIIAGGDSADLCAQSVGMRFAELDMRHIEDGDHLAAVAHERCASSPESLERGCLVGAYFALLRQGMNIRTCDATVTCRAASEMLRLDRAQ